MFYNTQNELEVSDSNEYLTGKLSKGTEANGVAEAFFQSVSVYYVKLHGVMGRMLHQLKTLT